MPQIVPLSPSLPWYRLNTSLDGKDGPVTPYIFDVRWNERDQAWYFDLLDGSETIIASGLKIVLGAYIGRTTQHAFFKTGALVAIDTTGQGLDAGFDDLGTRVKLFRLTLPDIISITGAP